MAILEHGQQETARLFGRAAPPQPARHGEPTRRGLSYYGAAVVPARPPAAAAWAGARGADPQPDVYLNLGQVYLLAGKTGRALEAFEAGLRIDPEHAGLREILRDHDRRGPLPLSMLARSNPINRWLGRARSVFLNRARP